MVGRDVDVGRVLDALSLSPLVTITGFGGVGKTRLALEVANRLGATFEVLFVDLEQEASTGGVLDAVCRLAANDGALGADPIETLAHLLGERPVLLVLDCFDTAVHALGDLDLLVERLPEARVMVTSIERTGARAELVVSLAPLIVPGVGDDVGSALANPSVQLLLAHAKLAGRPIEVASRADVDALVALAARSSGLPLALELLAGWLGVMTIRELATTAERSTMVFRKHRIDASRRHASIADGLNASTSRLDERERELLQVLATLRCPADRELLTLAIAHEVDVPLMTLVERHLVVRGQHSGRATFDLLDPVRLHLLDEPVADAAHCSVVAAEALARRLETLLPAVGRNDSAATLDQIDALGPAIAWAIDELAQRSLAAACALAGALVPYWVLAGRQNAGIDIVTALVSRAGGLPHLVAQLRAARAELSAANGNLASAAIDAADALATSNDMDVRCIASLCVARSHMAVAGWRSVVAALEPHVADWSLLARTTRVRLATALGGAYFNVGRYDDMAPLLARAAAVHDAALTAQFDLMSLSIVNARSRRQPLDRLIVEGAALLTGWARPCLEELRLRYWLTVLLLQRGDTTEALRIGEPLVEHADILGLPKWKIMTRLAWARCVASGGQHDRARALFEVAADDVLRVGDPMTDLMHHLAPVARQLGFNDGDVYRMAMTSVAVLRVHDGVVPDRGLLDVWFDELRAVVPLTSDQIEQAWDTVMTPEQLICEFQWVRDRLRQQEKSTAAPAAPLLDGISLREHEVLELAARGLTDRDIASVLHISTRTASNHLERIYRKLGVRTRREAIALWRQACLVIPTPPA